MYLQFKVWLEAPFTENRKARNSYLGAEGSQSGQGYGRENNVNGLKHFCPMNVLSDNELAV